MPTRSYDQSPSALVPDAARFSAREHVGYVSMGIPNLGWNGEEHFNHHSQDTSSIPPTAISTHTLVDLPGSPLRAIEPIPQPTAKVAYAAPIFRTFQERKRDAELALRAQAGYSGPSDGPQPVRPAPTAPLAAATGDTRSSVALKRPITNAAVSAAPTSFGSITGSRPLPVSASIAAGAGRVEGRPLPSPLIISPGASSAGPSTPTRIRQTPVSPRTTVSSPLERSDTVSSVKSLDRFAFSSPGKRPLPRPPVVVNSSKSLDRGIPSSSAIGNIRMVVSRKQPSTVLEVSEEEITPRHSKSSREQSSAMSEHDARSPAVPVLVMEPSETFSSLPETTSPHLSNGTKHSMPGLPGIVLGGLPVISVSSFEESSGEMSIAVPAISSSCPTPPRSPLTAVPNIKLEQSTRTHPSTAMLCASCSIPIIGRIVNAMNQRWHPQCFMCGECGELLEHVSSYEWEGKPYCHLDYHDKFAHRCHHCKTPIVDPRFVTLSDPVLGQRYYHELHFFCSECGDPFLDPSRSSAPGTERSREAEDDDGETNAFIIHKGHPYCENCHLRLHKPKCRGCSKPIPDVAVSALGTRWHKQCFVCSKCGDAFANNLFVPVEHEALCTACYEHTL